MVTSTTLTTAEQAEKAFYAAFEKSDPAAMMEVWAEDGNIMCIHPNGPRLVGQQEVREGWQQIMKYSPSMRFELTHLDRVESDDLAVHYVNEHIYVGKQKDPDFTVLATNVYRRTAQGWRMIMHHASPTPESLRSMQDRLQEEAQQDEVTLH